MKYEERLNSLKEDLDKAKNLKYQAEARLEQLKKQEKEIIAELDELGIDPDQLNEEINNLESTIEELFKQASLNLPKDLLKGD